MVKEESDIEDDWCKNIDNQYNTNISLLTP